MEMAQLTTLSSSLQQSIDTSSKEMNICSKPFSILTRIVAGESLHQSNLCYFLGHPSVVEKLKPFHFSPFRWKYYALK